MKFSVALIATFAALAIAAPTGTQQKRAAVLGTKTYDEYVISRHHETTETINISRLSIFGGTAGNAEQEALDVFSALDLTNMAAVDPVSLLSKDHTRKC